MPEHSLPHVIAPMITPYDDDLMIDYNSASIQASRLAKEGIGVFIAGTTGEMPLLLPDEKKRLVSAVKKGIGDRTPVIIGSGWPNPYLVLQEAHELEAYGISALVVPPPYYYPIPSYSVEGFYRWLSRNLRIPLLIYTIPSHTGINIDVELIASIANEENIIGIKATVSDINYQVKLIQYVKEAHPDFLVYSGLDNLLLYNLLTGGDGGIVAGANLTPKLHAALIEAVAKDELKEAIKLHRLILKINWVLEPARSLQGGIKTILVHEGVIEKDYVRPPLPNEDNVSRETIIERWKKSGLRDYF